MCPAVNGPWRVSVPKWCRSSGAGRSRLPARSATWIGGTGAHWRTSTRSGGNSGECVAVAGNRAVAAAGSRNRSGTGHTSRFATKQGQDRPHLTFATTALVHLRKGQQDDALRAAPHRQCPRFIGRRHCRRGWRGPQKSFKQQGVGIYPSILSSDHTEPITKLDGGVIAG